MSEKDYLFDSMLIVHYTSLIHDSFDAAFAEIRVPRARNWLIVHAPGDEYVNTVQASNFVERLRSEAINVAPLCDDVQGNHFDAVNDVASPASMQLFAHIWRFLSSLPEFEALL